VHIQYTCAASVLWVDDLRLSLANPLSRINLPAAAACYVHAELPTPTPAGAGLFAARTGRGLCHPPSKGKHVNSTLQTHTLTRKYMHS
jgi:hypothetical protein